MNFTMIVKNEFTGLISNKYIFIILLFFLINTVIVVSDVCDGVSDGTEPWRIISGSFFELSYLLSLYGGVMALLIGFSSMTDELSSRAINTLLVKPVYRDTIINGKLAGCTGFILGFFCLTSAIYLAVLIALFGSVISPALPEIIIRLPLIIFFALSCSMIFFSLAVFLRILVRDSTSSLLITVLAFLIVEYLMPNAVFTGQVGALIGLNDQDALRLIAGLSPWWASEQVTSGGLFNFDLSLFQVFSNCWPEYAKLCVMNVVLAVASYVSFMRKDVT